VGFGYDGARGISVPPRLNNENGLSLYCRLSLRLVEGFSLNLSGYASRIHNLLSLPKGEATEEEVFLRRRQLAKSYDYFGSVGISYSFGSIYNSIVNPRFGDQMISTGSVHSPSVRRERNTAGPG